MVLYHFRYLSKGTFPFIDAFRSVFVLKKHNPKGINKGKGAFWEIARMVKCKTTALKALTKRKFLLGDSENGKVKINLPKGNPKGGSFAF